MCLLAHKKKKFFFLHDGRVPFEHVHRRRTRYMIMSFPTLKGGKGDVMGECLWGPRYICKPSQFLIGRESDVFLFFLKTWLY